MMEVATIKLETITFDDVLIGSVVTFASTLFTTAGQPVKPENSSYLVLLILELPI